MFDVCFLPNWTIKYIAKLMDLCTFFWTICPSQSSLLEIFPGDVRLPCNGTWYSVHVLLRANQSLHGQVRGWPDLGQYSQCNHFITLHLYHSKYLNILRPTQRSQLPFWKLACRENRRIKCNPLLHFIDCCATFVGLVPEAKSKVFRLFIMEK